MNQKETTSITEGEWSATIIDGGKHYSTMIGYCEPNESSEPEIDEEE